jgi:hypothetical protein
MIEVHWTNWRKCTYIVVMLTQEGGRLNFSVPAELNGCPAESNQPLLVNLICRKLWLCKEILANSCGACWHSDSISKSSNLSTVKTANGNVWKERWHITEQLCTIAYGMLRNLNIQLLFASLVRLSGVKKGGGWLFRDLRNAYRERELRAICAWMQSICSRFPLTRDSCECWLLIILTISYKVHPHRSS